jgi:probable F420-dependent oxidoreductase
MRAALQPTNVYRWRLRSWELRGIQPTVEGDHRMHWGVAMFLTEDAMRPGELARAVEERGFESLWFTEHSHIPASRVTPWPGGDELPAEYYGLLDPFVSLAFAAEATRSLKLGTGVCLVVQRDPIQTAKAVATIDVLSGGRFLFGVGGGWNREEMENHGTRYEARWKILRERIEAMKEIWTRHEATYEGETVSFERIIADPKPAQKPHPPIHVGGAFPGGMKRAVWYGDGWIPLLGRDDDDVAKHMAAFRRAAAEAGRDPAALEVTLYACPPDPELVKRSADAGISRIVFRLPTEKSDEVLRFLDRVGNSKDRVRSA